LISVILYIDQTHENLLDNWLTMVALFYLLRLTIALTLSHYHTITRLHYHRILHRICAGVFCDSCCILPAESVGLVFAGKQKQNAASKLSGDSSGAGEETSIATMRICDGEKRITYARTRYCAVQYSTVQYSTVQYSTVQYSNAITE
jgi:hypothetical protein